MKSLAKDLLRLKFDSMYIYRCKEYKFTQTLACLYGSTYMDTRDRQIHGQSSCVLPGNIDRMEVFNISMVTDAFTQSTIRALCRTINKESFHP